MPQRVTVIPCMRLPRHLGFFDYAHEKNLQTVLVPGSFVDIPFRNKTVTGLVLHVTQEPVDGLKTIGEVRDDLVSLSTQEIEYILQTARWYCVSPSTIVRIMYPLPLTKKYKRKTPNTSLLQPTPRQLSLQTATRPVLFHYTQQKECITYYRSLISAYRKQKKQLVIITPTQQHTDRLVSALPSHKDIIVSSSEDGLKKEKMIRDRAHTDSATTFIGTRNLLYIPYLTLGMIIVDHSEHRGHKLFESTPLLDTCISAYHKANIHQASLVYTSCAPRLEELSYTTCTHPKTSGSPQPVLIDLHDEFRSGNTTYISEHLQKNIAVTLKNRNSVVLYLNHKGTSKYVVCKGCNTIFSCPHCGSYLRYTQTGQRLSCSPCHYTQSLPDQCPSCRGVTFIFPGLGIEKIAQQLKELFTNTPIITVDAEISTTLPPTNTPHIIIGTSYLLAHRPDIFSTAGLVGCITIDPITSMEQFRSLEHQWQEYAFLFSLVSDEAQCVIQAFNIDHPFVQSLATLDYHIFANNELALRQSHHLPPYHQQIACTYKGSCEHEEKEVSALVQACKSSIDISKDSSTVVVIQKTNQRPHTIVLINLSSQYNPLWKMPPSLSGIILKLGVDWMIDPNPRIL